MITDILILLMGFLLIPCTLVVSIGMGFTIVEILSDKLERKFYR